MHSNLYAVVVVLKCFINKVELSELMCKCVNHQEILLAYYGIIYFIMLLDHHQENVAELDLFKMLSSVWGLTLRPQRTQ